MIAYGRPLRRCRGRIAAADGGCLAGPGVPVAACHRRVQPGLQRRGRLNCVANSRLERDGPFEALHVYAAPHDAGTASVRHLRPRADIPGRFRGPGQAGPSLTPFLGASSTTRRSTPPGTLGACRARVPDPELRAASLLADGRIVAWFQGRMEFGPRALGNRSLLADPRHPEMRERLNRRIKHRESFRPFAASVLEEEAAAWFEFPMARSGARFSRDLMLLAYRVGPT